MRGCCFPIATPNADRVSPLNSLQHDVLIVVAIRTFFLLLLSLVYGRNHDSIFAMNGHVLCFFFYHFYHRIILHEGKVLYDIEGCFEIAKRSWTLIKRRKKLKSKLNNLALLMER